MTKMASERRGSLTAAIDFRFARNFLLTLIYVGCLRSFLALHDLELNGIALLQAFITFRTDGAVVDEHIRPVVSSNKAVSFGVVEPLHSTFQTIHVRPLQSALMRTPSENLLPLCVR